MFLNVTKVNDLVPLTMAFMLKIAFSDFVNAGGKVFHKHILFIAPLFNRGCFLQKW